MSKSLFSAVKNKLVDLTGIWFYKVNKLPVGTHLYYFLKHRIRFPFQVIFDVGSNVGDTVLMYHKHFPQARIYCFEPFAKAFGKLGKNTGGYPNIILNQLALGDSIESLDIPLKSDEHTNVNTLKTETIGHGGSMGSERISVETLDHYLEQHPEIGQIDLLKIDTEGYDLKVLTGAHKTLSQAKAKMIFTEVGFSKENNLHVKLCEMIPFLEKYEYTFLGIFSMDVNNLHRRPQFGNALFIHRSLVNAVVNA